MASYARQVQTAERAFSRLTSASISRSPPVLPSVVCINLRESVLTEKPFELIGLWGGSKICKPPTDIAGQPEEESLLFLGQIKRQLEFQGLSVNLSLLFCDAHHIIVNGIALEASNHYYESLLPLAKSQGINITRLGETIQKPMVIANYTDYDSRLRALDVVHQLQHVEAFMRGVLRHCARVGLEIEDPLVAGMAYIEMEIYFMRTIYEKIRPTGAFFAFSDPNVQHLIAEAAQVPMLHFNATSQGDHYCPWFRPNS